MATAHELVGKTITATVKLHRYRYPLSAHVSGTYAVAVLDVIKVLEGEIGEGCLDKNDHMILAGNMPKLEEGIEYTLEANLVTHKDYGFQYECVSLRLAYDMKNKEDQKKFFSFFLTDKQIDALFEAYDNPVAILDQKNLGALTKIKGIGPVTANRICNKYSENINNSRAYVELNGLGITKSAIDKLINQFGSADVVVDIIKSNPYSLIKLVRGYGWRKADALALSQGLPRDSRERCLAYANYILEQYADVEGNSCMSIGELIDNVMVECRPVIRDDLVIWLKEDMIGEKDFEKLYKKICDEEKNLEIPTFFYSKEKRKVGLLNLRILERTILDQLIRLKNAPSTFTYDKEVCEKIISEVEAEQGYKYTHEQHNAIWNVLNNNVSILTGSSGTGKSSTLKPLIKIFNHYHLKAEQCALSGRAASLLTEYTGLQGKTIHRLLKYLPDEERFAHSARNPLPADVVVLDETSMVGEELFCNLISAIKNGSKLVMLGDIKQLPPMSVGNILSDTIKSGFVPTSTLTIIQRQALKSGIVAQSIHVCEGKSIVKNNFIGEEVRGELKDFKLVCSSESLLVHNKALEEFKHLYRDRRISPDDIQIVVPQRINGMNSCRQLNSEIQEIVNGGYNSKQIQIEVREKSQVFTVVYKPGDRIMVVRNNYHARTTLGKEVAIFNGNMGHIITVASDAMIIELEEQGQVILPREEWNNIQHSWACTCHKLQGSQAQYVIVVLDKGSFKLLTREWLYTALTRARKYCVLVGQPDAINMATRTSDIKIKQTWLKDDLYQAFLQEQGVTA